MYNYIIDLSIVCQTLNMAAPLEDAQSIICLDMVILSPSANALQKLLDICSVYSEKHDIVYNVKAKMWAISSDTHQLHYIPKHHFII